MERNKESGIIPKLFCAQIIAVLMGYAISLHVSIFLMGVFQGLGFVLALVLLFWGPQKKTIRNHFYRVLKSPVGRGMAWLIVPILISLIAFQLRDFPIELSAGDLIRPYKKVFLYLGPLWFGLLLVSLPAKIFKKSLNLILMSYLTAAVITGILGCIQFWTPIDFWGVFPQLVQGIPENTHFHSVGLVGFHLSYAGIMVFPAGLLMAHSLHAKDSSFRLRILSTCAFGITIAALLFTWSKMAWFSIPFLLLIVCAFRGGNWVIAVGVISLFMGIGVLTLFEEVQERLLHLISYRDRLDLWKVNMEMFLDYPIFGTGFLNNEPLSKIYMESLKGPGVRTFVSHAHNNWIDFWAGTGLVGLTGFFIFWCYVGKSLWYLRKGEFSWLGIGLIAGFFAFHINGMTQANFSSDSKVIHSVLFHLAIIIVLWDYKKREELVPATTHPL